MNESPEEREPERHTGYLLRRAQQAHLAAWNEIVSTEVSSVQYSILVTLERMGEASQRELCDEVDLDRSTIADLVRRMERRDLIARRASPDDARRKIVTLTPAGERERLRLRPLVHRVEERLTGSFSAAERDDLRAGLRHILAQRESALREQRRTGGQY